ncbi:echinoderm microtubule-associated protein-like 2 isoform X1 [Erpetoichthys calabaricus]|uniref:echinoderm microtubule-associated protein-like 2 isoform X1 n=1 Tax=Erpetoichthys calabaricus TaxID=27687 RepID=UPI00223458F2|nr:echinoderm microtubule-associated protein-like 2 isoform X1 [Erpetoichthys calabaricus]
MAESLYDTSCLSRYCNDDSLSVSSSMEVDDRLSYLEQRVQLQEDEIQLLKAALADVLRRLSSYEEQSQIFGKRIGPTKMRQILQALPSKPSFANGYIPQRKLGGYPSSPSSPKKEMVTRYTSFSRSVSTERLSSLRREGSADSRSRTTSSSSSSSGKKEGKPKDAVFSADDGHVKMFLRGRPVTMPVPEKMKDTYSLNARSELPARSLKLHWVYGYRGRDCRCNLFLLPTGEIVYFIASVVVLYNPEEQQQRHYMGHNDDIKCLAVHPDMVTIVTGQVAGTSKDGKMLPPHIRVWDSVSLNTLHVLGSGYFDRAVTCVGFSKSNGGAYLCAVDDANDHILSVWEWQKEKKLAEVKCSQDSVLAAQFHPLDSNLILTCGKSHINFWTIEGVTLTKKQGLFEKHEKPKYVLSIAFAENGDAITGDSSGNIYVWGKGGTRINLELRGAHEGGVFSLCVLKDGTLVSGGGKDRKLVLWDRDYQKQEELEVPEILGPVRCIAEGKLSEFFVGTTRNAIVKGSFGGEMLPVVQGHMDELWGLDTHPTMEQFVTCGQDKLIHLWDTTTHKPLWSKCIEDAARSVGFHPSATVLAVGTMAGKWLVLDMETQDLVSAHTDGNEIISVVKYSPDGMFLAVASHDNMVYVYSVSEGGRKYTRVGKCTGHSSFVTHLDWSVDSQHFVTNSGDYEILYWNAPTCKQLTCMDTVRMMDWATYTCTLGFSVFGIWPEGADGTDINACNQSHDQKLLASADDFGKVHLFSFPSSHPRAPSHMYGGHSSHVTNVAFLHDDSRLVSTGGKDMSILLWAVV